jgi:hypothetical protein
MRVAVVRRYVAGLATLVDVGVRVLHTIVAMGMDMEVALGPPEEESECEKHDDQADGHLGSPDQPLR